MCTIHQVRNNAAQNAVQKFFSLPSEQRGTVTRKLVQHIAIKAQGEYDDNGERFLASEGWFRKACDRLDLKQKRVHGTRARQSKPSGDEYSNYISSFLTDMDISLHAVFNADETHVALRPEVKTTYLQGDELVPESRGVEKEGLSALTCSNASGI